jgi:hypothetical protein
MQGKSIRAHFAVGSLAGENGYREFHEVLRSVVSG